MNEKTPSVTVLLAQAKQGCSDSYQRVFKLVYHELKKLAKGIMADEHVGHTLQPAALVNEAYLKLANHEVVSSETRKDFLNLAAVAMRQVLVSHARKKMAQKGAWAKTRQFLTLDKQVQISKGSPHDLLVIDETLLFLEKNPPRQANILNMKLFAGLTFKEIAEIEHLSETHVRNEFKKARAWLIYKLG